jgi:hypothetical protein
MAHPELLNKLLPASDPSTCDRETFPIQVRALYYLLSGRGKIAIKHALQAGALPILAAHLSNGTGGVNSREAAAQALCAICLHVCDPELSIAQEAGPLIKVLVGTVSDSFPAVRAAIVQVIMALSINVDCKKQFVKEGVVDKLIDLLCDYDPIVLFSTLKVITLILFRNCILCKILNYIMQAVSSIAEDYPARYAFLPMVPKVILVCNFQLGFFVTNLPMSPAALTLTNFKMEELLTHPDDLVCKTAQRAIDVVKWRP